FAFGNLRSLFEFQTAFFTVASKQPPHCIRMRGKIGQRFVDGDREGTKFLEVLVMRCPLFGLLPQIFNPIIIRRLSRETLHWNARARGRQNRLGRGTGMIPSPIMDEKKVLRGLRHEHLWDPLVTFRIKPTLDALKEEAPRKILNGPKDLVAFALATGGHLRLTSPSGPGVAQRAPLRKARLLFKQKQTMTPLGCPENGRPFLRAARPGAWPCRDDPTQNGLFETKSPGCAAAYRHTGDCRAPQIPARSAHG